MDEAALRAMMPMSFGKSKKPSAVKPKPPPLSSTHTSASGSSVHKRPATSPPPHPGPSSSHASAVHTKADDGDVDENGLTAADRALNAELEYRQANAASEDDDEDQDNDDEEKEERPASRDTAAARLTLPPMSHEALLKSHTKTVSALALDPGGARIATGSYDYDLKLWDFGGMDSSLKPFRSFTPAGSYPINDLAFSPHGGGENVLCISATATAKVFDRDGAEVGTCKKGDPYLRDMRQTKGHIAELSAGGWDPSERGRFMTASSDSTVRFWHVDDLNLGQRDMIVLKSRERGNRTKVTAAKYGEEGRVLAAAGLDGALHWWDLRANLASRPRGSVERAHEAGRCISCVTFSRDGKTLATRGGDETVKLWDRRMFRAPVATRGGLPSSVMTDVIFGPDEKSVLTGVSAVPLGARGGTGGSGSGAKHEAEEEEDEQHRSTKETTTGGSICVLSLPDLEEVQRYSISSSSVLRLSWHARLNQLFATTRTGGVHVFYSPTASVNGALLAVGRKPKQRNPFNVDLTPVPFDPEAAKLAPSASSKRRKMEKLRADPIASRMPERPISGPGRGGRIGAAATQHVVQSIYKDNSRSEDPREALLRYADEAKKNPIFTKVYSETQPKTIYAQDDDDGGDEEQPKR
ncbi:hypothetical protein ACQY0O_001400 [Thecaphora frezii]